MFAYGNKWMMSFTHVSVISELPILEMGFTDYPYKNWKGILKNIGPGGRFTNILKYT